MGITRLFLLDAHVHDVQINDALEAACLEGGFPVSRLRVDPTELDGSDVAALDLLEEVRRLMRLSGPDQGLGQAVLIGYGLSATLALWMDMVDLARPKKIQVGKFALELEDDPPEVAPALAGVVAIAPFLGMDFSVRSGRLGAEGASDFRLRLSRKPFWARLIGNMSVGNARDHGCGSSGPISWSTLAKVLPFASVAKLVPSFKRPTVLVMDLGPQKDRVEVQLCALSGRVSVLDSPAVFPLLGQVTLAAVAQILKG
ncbi:MAG: hypothetical protein RJA58_593 [Pseudomonadota bacterium]|jgi:hypothetical protein